jgi:uncharacterized RDD family membrane protein YckC
MPETTPFVQGALDLDLPAEARPMDLAELPVRIKAGILDGLIAFLPAGIATGILNAVVLSHLPLPGFLLGIVSGAGTAAAAAGVFYAVNRTSLERDGQTFGKRCFGIRIAKPDGSVPPLSDSFVKRWLWVFGAGALVPFVGPLVPLADLVMLFLSKDRRALHDVLAGTVVVKLGGQGRKSPPTM